MLINDRIYGQVKITDPVILDLINCPSLQRLKQVDQAGWFEPYYPKTQLSRFEHSVGVYLLLKKYGANIHEQIAGLIHDVSHAAFSHCIDYVLKEGSPKAHDHQDNIFKEFVLKTEIPQILRKYKIDINFILNDVNFPLKEKQLPDLCADRIDYALRAAIIFKEISLRKVNDLLDNLIVENNLWVFRSFRKAQAFANLFSCLNNKYWAGLASALMFQTVGDYLRYALLAKYINYNDLYTTDNEVISKISKHLEKDKELIKLWNRMNKKVSIQNNPKHYDVGVFVKSRAIDPWYKTKQYKLRLSDKNPTWKGFVSKASQPIEYFLQFPVGF